MSKINIRNYDNEFKNNTILLYLSGGKSYPQLGEELGIVFSIMSVCGNISKYYTSCCNRKITEAELTELVNLCKELAYVKYKVYLKS